MSAHNKIGFHLSPGGTAIGLGEWMKALDAAGIPFCIKSADSAGPVFEGQQLAKASGVPHVLVYRKSGLGWDLPDYNLLPEEAAKTHWDRHRTAFPPELDKKLVWLETINEVDKLRADWLGNFAYATGLLAIQQGFRWAAFGWSSGEPEPLHWQTPGMLKYLRLCAQYPEQLAVAIHEYSYTNSDIRHDFPFKIGRVQALFETCDRQSIPRPTVLITEWGWRSDSVPEPTVAMEHIRWAAEFYAQFRTIRGIALWHLGGGYGGIASKAQRLIAPLKEYSLQTVFPDLPLDDPPGKANRFTFVDDVTIPDGTVIRKTEPFTKTWRIKNTGENAWTADYRLIFFDGEKMNGPDQLVLPETPPGTEIELSVNLIAPEQTGLYRSRWRFCDPDGIPFGRPIWAEIEVMDDMDAREFDQYHFIRDITIPDGTRIPVGTEFIKVWRVRNTGNMVWKKDYQLAFVSGDQMEGPDAQPLHKDVSAGETTDISLVLRAPDAPGRYHGNWYLRTPLGEPLGPIIWVEITIAPKIPVTDGFHWPVGNRSNLAGWADVNPFLRRNGRGEYHPGADFNDMGWGDHDLGAPIYAVAHGIVRNVGSWPVWGNLILIEHHLPDGRTVWSQYAHCRDLLCKKGDIVTRGSQIGTIGKGDRDRYWAHLHFEIRRVDLHIASWLVQDPKLVAEAYYDPIGFIHKNLAPED